MGWEDNDFDFMSDGGYTSEGGLDFGENVNTYTPDFGNYGDYTGSDFNFTPFNTTSDYTGGSDFGNWSYDLPNDFQYPDQSAMSPEQLNAAMPPVQGNNYMDAGIGGGGSSKSFLQSLFSNPLTNMGIKGLSALLEGSQNKKKATALNNLANSSKLDPFGSQRAFYQQQAQQAVTNPYDSAIVKSQVANLQRMQDIKDAAAGRRSNSLSTSPGVLAEQAKIAQNYLNSMLQAGGSKIDPNSSAITSAATGAINADTAGYTSPLMSALGNISTQQNNNALLEKLFSNKENKWESL